MACALAGLGKDQVRVRGQTFLHGYKSNVPAYKTVINNFTVIKGEEERSSLLRSITPPLFVPRFSRVIAFFLFYLPVHLLLRSSLPGCFLLILSRLATELRPRRYILDCCARSVGFDDLSVNLRNIGRTSVQPNYNFIQ